MYKEINLPEVLAAIISNKGGNLKVKKEKLTDVKTAIINRDKFMRVDFSAQQYRRVDYLGDGYIKVAPKVVVVKKEIPLEVKNRFRICYNSLDEDSRVVLDLSLKSVFK